MTEEEWMASHDPVAMLNVLRGLGSKRKLLLFGTTCCRLNWSWLGKRWQRAVEATAAYADGDVIQDEAEWAWHTAVDLEFELPDRATWDQRKRRNAALFAYHAADPTPLVPSADGVRLFMLEAIQSADLDVSIPTNDNRTVAALLREHFGNPFRPVAFDPRWRSPDVTGLARAIYEDRAWDRMPLLADALMDAGCDSDDVLSHCRGEGPHARGCWVVDLVLGKG